MIDRTLRQTRTPCDLLYLHLDVAYIGASTAAGSAGGGPTVGRAGVGARVGVVRGGLESGGAGVRGWGRGGLADEEKPRRCRRLLPRAELPRLKMVTPVWSWRLWWRLCDCRQLPSRDCHSKHILLWVAPAARGFLVPLGQLAEAPIMDALLLLVKLPAPAWNQFYDTHVLYNERLSTARSWPLDLNNKKFSRDEQQIMVTVACCLLCS